MAIRNTVSIDLCSLNVKDVFDSRLPRVCLLEEYGILVLISSRILTNRRSMEVVTGEAHSVHLHMVYRRNHWEQGISSYHHYQIFD